MSDTEIGIYISSQERLAPLDDEEYLCASQKFQKQLEDEFGLPFVDTDIGTGAAEGAFFAKLIVDHWPYAVLLGAFFQGKSINENIDAWIELGKKLTGFLKWQPIFDRAGSAVLAVQEIISRVGHLPKSMRLVGYKRTTFFDKFEGKEDPGYLTEIDPAPENVTSG
ncbi:MAG: hypothetical protein ACLP8A_14270 [Methylovirgula sp.]